MACSGVAVCAQCMPEMGMELSSSLSHEEFLQRLRMLESSFEGLTCLDLSGINGCKFSELYHQNGFNCTFSHFDTALTSFMVLITLVKGSSVPATLNHVCGFDMWALNMPCFLQMRA